MLGSPPVPALCLFLWWKMVISKKTILVTEFVARDYLSAFANQKPDTLVLGCTHYPLIAPLIGQIMGSGTVLIDPGGKPPGW